MTIGDDSTTVTFKTDDGTKSVASLNDYTVAFEVIDNGNGLGALLRSADGSTLSDVRGGSLEAGGSVGAPDGQLAFACSH